MTRKHVETKVLFELLKFLDKSLIRKEDGYVEFVNGVDDGKVAEVFGVSASYVANTRVKTFGKLPRGPVPGAMPPHVQLVKRVDDVIERLERIERRLAEVEDHVTGADNMTLIDYASARAKEHQ